MCSIVKAQAVGDEIAALKDMSRHDLRTAWRLVHRNVPPNRLSRDLLERAFGGLGAAAKRQLDAVARSIDCGSDVVKARRIELRPGARLIREWAGEAHEVLVTEEGFLWRGKSWRSLSVIAREITGARWSGPRFFGLQKNAMSSERGT